MIKFNYKQNKKNKNINKKNLFYYLYMINYKMKNKLKK